MSIYFYGKVSRLLVEGEAYFGGLTIVRHAISAYTEVTLSRMQLAERVTTATCTEVCSCCIAG